MTHRDLDAEARRRILETGLRDLAEGRFLASHESFEDLWKSAPNPSERDLWQGLAQLAAALVKHERDEPTTAISLLARARARLAGSRHLRPAVDALREWIDSLAGPVTNGRALGSTTLPAGVAEALRAVVRGGDDAAPEAVS